MTENYIQFSVPGVPYSAIRIPLTDDAVETAAWMDRALSAGEYLARHYRDTFREAPPEFERVPLEDDSPFFHGDEEPNGVQVVIDPQTHEARMPEGERVTGEHFACPDCGQPAKPSVDRYQQWEPGNDGRMYAQKWFCPNNGCQTKSLWRSKLRPLQMSTR